MIEPKDKDKVWINFSNWTSDMMALASKIHNMPDPPGEVIVRNHEVGIDELSDLPGGHLAIDALFYLVDDLTYRPSDVEVVALGKIVLMSMAELNKVMVTREREARQRRPTRTLPKAKTSPIRVRTPESGFVRRN
jgi:hypothetical protein